jgi:hypothetical protein
MLFTSINKLNIVYWQIFCSFLKKKEIVKAGDPAKYVKRDVSDLTESYKRFMLKETVLDFVTHVLQVSDTAYNERFFSLFFLKNFYSLFCE